MLGDMGEEYPHDDRDDPDFGDDHEPHDEDDCWRCHGEGWGIVGVDWDTDDGVNGPFDGEVEACDCCRGTGLAKDCWYW